MFLTTTFPPKKPIKKMFVLAQTLIKTHLVPQNCLRQTVLFSKAQLSQLRYFVFYKCRVRFTSLLIQM